jgi:hypothetical protein
MKNRFQEVEGFFQDPDKIREIALGPTFEYWPAESHPDGGNWPGIRSPFISAVDQDVFDQIVASFYKTQGWELSRSVYFESYFQSFQEKDGASWVHTDIMHQDWTYVCIAYLTPDAPPSGGTLFYEPKGGLTLDELKAKHDGEVPGDDQEYNVIHDSPNQYNKAIVYLPEELHKSNVYFGDTFRNSRLIQISFIRDNEAHPTSGKTGQTGSLS